MRCSKVMINGILKLILYQYIFLICLQSTYAYASNSAQELVFAKRTITNKPVITALWKVPNKSKIKSQQIQLYSGRKCDPPITTPVPIATNVSSKEFNVNNNGFYTFQILTIEANNSRVISKCSAPIEVDTLPPSTAKKLWSRKSKKYPKTYWLRWNKSKSKDLTRQEVSLYKDGNCKKLLNKPSSFPLNTKRSFRFETKESGIYSFNVTSIDKAGNKSFSRCSSPIKIKHKNPFGVAKKLHFKEGRRATTKKIKAKWKRPKSKKILKQTLQLFSDKKCSSLSGKPIAIRSKKTQSKTIVVKKDGLYSFKIINIGKSNLKAISECSTPILVDTTPPAPPTNLHFVSMRGNSISKRLINKGQKITTKVKAKWNISHPDDLSEQFIYLYSNKLCKKRSFKKIKLSKKINSYNFEINKTGNYSFKIISNDKLGNSGYSNCSSPLRVVTIDILSTPYNLNFEKQPLTSNKTINAHWDLDESYSFKSQVVQFFKDNKCTVPFIEPIKIESKKTTSQILKTKNDGFYTFQVKTFGTTGETRISKCSPPIKVDTTAPHPTANVFFSEGKNEDYIFLPYLEGQDSIHAKWKKIITKEQIKQKIAFYSDDRCNNLIGKEINIANPNVESYKFKVPSNGTYSFKVTSTDNAFNISHSECSKPLRVILKKPLKNAKKLSLKKQKISDRLELKATWKKSISKDLSGQIIELFHNNSCKKQPLKSITLQSKKKENKTIAITKGGAYSYKIISIGSSGYQIASNCSSSVYVDTIPPTPAKNLSFIKKNNQGDSVYLGYMEGENSIEVIWEKSKDPMLAKQEILFYINKDCEGKAEKSYTTKSVKTESFKFKIPIIGQYSFRVNSYDKAGNSALSECSTPLTIILKKPLKAASNLSFQRQPITNKSIITAKWNKSSSFDLTKQLIQYYSDKSCSKIIDEPIKIEPLKTESHSFITKKNGHYSFKIISVGSTGYKEHSKCSPSIEVDTTLPNAASNLSFKHGKYKDKIFFYTTKKRKKLNLYLDINWNISSSKELYKQYIYLYGDSFCKGLISDKIDVKSTKTNSHRITFPNPGKYSFKIASTDRAGNNTFSPCSSPFEIISTSHIGQAYNLSFENNSSSSTLKAITAKWKTNTSKDYKKHIVQFYNGKKCKTTVSKPIELTSSDIQKTTYQVPKDGFYTFQVTTVGYSDIKKVSKCSRPIYVNYSLPAPATNLVLKEGTDKNKLYLSFLKGDDSVHASWTKSISKDNKKQKITFYSGDKCQRQKFLTNVTLESTKQESFKLIIPNPGIYSFNVSSIDILGNTTVSNCSNPLNILFKVPLDSVQNLTFKQWPSTNSKNINAIWRKSQTTDLSNQMIQFFNGVNCKYPLSDIIDLKSPNVENKLFKVDREGQYSFKIFSIGSTGYKKPSKCSKAIIVDSTPPKPATNLHFRDKNGRKSNQFSFISLEEEKNNPMTIQARWRKSNSNNLYKQKVVLYSDGNCNTKLYDDLKAEPNKSYLNFKISNVGTYSYKVISFDQAQNTSSSKCSSALKVTIQLPSPEAQRLSFSESSSTNKSTIHASWYRSRFKNIKNQLIQFYKGDKCNKSLYKTIDLKSSSIESYSLKVPKDGKYTFKIITVNNSGQKRTSQCSWSVKVDTKPPKPATALSFKEKGDHKKLYLTSSWIPTPSDDVVVQKLQLFTGPKCSQPIDMPILINNSTQSTKILYVKEAKTYSFKIASIDEANNQTLSKCSMPTKITDGYSAFKLFLNEEDIEQEEDEDFVYIDDRLAVEYELGYAKTNGFTQSINYSNSYLSTRLTVHTKPFAFSDFARTSGSLAHYFAEFTVGLFYQRGVVEYATIDGSSGTKSYPQTYGLYLYEYFWKNFLIKNLKIGPQVIFENYSNKIKDKTAFKNVEYSNYKFGITMNYNIPRLLSNITVDYNYAPSVAYEQDPKVVSGNIAKVTSYDYSIRFLRRYTRQFDLGFGYDYKKLSMTMTGAKQRYLLPKESNHKFGLFIMFHLE